MAKKKETVENFDLFGTAEVVNKEKKDERISVNIGGDVFDKKLKELDVLNADVAVKEAKIATLKEDIKQIGMEKWIDVYKNKAKNPESIDLVSSKGNMILYGVQRKYTVKCDDKVMLALNTKYADMLAKKKTVDVPQPKLVTENKEYIIKDGFIEKYATVLSKLISECKDIKPEDKNFLKVKKSYTVDKDAIDWMIDSGVEATEYITDLSPVQFVKEPKIVATEEKK